MTPLIYVLMCLAGGPGSLDLTADERFWRDEQSCAFAGASELEFRKLLPQNRNKMLLPVSLEIDLSLRIADKTNQRRTRYPPKRSIP
jgi:hypothetical protein